MVVTSNEPSPKLRVFTLDPLTFQCSECGQQFDASEPKTIAMLTAEIARHNRAKHAPESGGQQPGEVCA